jgi:hypothetical protein
MMFALLFVLAAAQASAPTLDAGLVALTAPQSIVEIDSGKIKGDPVRLAWSPDGTQLYFQVVEKDKNGQPKSSKQFVVSLADKKMNAVDQAPAWANAYWTWKSAQACPAAPAFKIDVSQHQEALRSTSSPTGGDLAKGGSASPTAGTSLGDMASAADNTQVQNVFTLKLKGETIGEWVNEAVAPGENFGWAPAPNRILAYASRTGGPLTLLDDQGHKHEMNTVKSPMLPAWSNDAKKMAWIERKDRKHFDVMVADVTER